MPDSTETRRYLNNTLSHTQLNALITDKFSAIGQEILGWQQRDDKITLLLKTYGPDQVYAGFIDWCHASGIVPKRVQACHVLVMTFASNPAVIAQGQEEARTIRDALARSRHGRSAYITERSIREIEGLTDIMKEVRPDILHVPAQGAEEGLALKNEHNEDVAVTADQIVKALEHAEHTPDFIVWSACCSDEVARWAGRAIGMQGLVTHVGLRLFARRLYGALGDGYSIQQAFERARLALEVHHSEEGQAPILVNDSPPGKRFFGDGDPPPRLGPLAAASGYVAMLAVVAWTIYTLLEKAFRP